MTSSRVVYSTAHGRTCATCGWPQGACRCHLRAEEKVPEKPVAKLRLETKGRGGKAVTVVDGLPKNSAFLAELAQALKKACGTGGTVREGCIELQGEKREQVAALLLSRGFVVKGLPK